MRRLLALLVLSALRLSGSYAYKGTVSFTGAAGSTQNNITLVFSFSDARLKTAANGGAIQNLCARDSANVPCDFVVTDDATCASLTGSYTWGWDTYSATAGTGLVWVRIPSYTTSGVMPNVCFGNSSISTYQGGSAGAEFDTSTKLALHFPDGSALNAADYSASGYNGTNSGATAVAGKIDGAGSFQGAAGMAIGANKTNLQCPTSFTVSAWIRLRSTSQSSFAWALTQDYTTPRSSPFANYALMANDSGANVWSFWYDFGGAAARLTSGVSRDTSWHYLAGTATSGSQVLYIDGSSAGTDNKTGSFSYNSSGVFEIGRNSDGSEAANADIDEVKVACTVRPQSWIQTEYANQNSPPSLGSIGAVSGGSGGYAANPFVIVEN